MQTDKIIEVYNNGIINYLNEHGLKVHKTKLADAIGVTRPTLDRYLEYLNDVGYLLPFNGDILPIKNIDLLTEDRLIELKLTISRYKSKMIALSELVESKLQPSQVQTVDELIYNEDITEEDLMSDSELFIKLKIDYGNDNSNFRFINLDGESVGLNKEGNMLIITTDSFDYGKCFCYSSKPKIYLDDVCLGVYVDISSKTVGYGENNESITKFFIRFNPTENTDLTQLRTQLKMLMIN